MLSRPPNTYSHTLPVVQNRSHHLDAEVTKEIILRVHSTSMNESQVQMHDCRELTSFSKSVRLPLGQWIYFKFYWGNIRTFKYCLLNESKVATSGNFFGYSIVTTSLKRILAAQEVSKGFLRLWNNFRSARDYDIHTKTVKLLQNIHERLLLRCLSLTAVHPSDILSRYAYGNNKLLLSLPRLFFLWGTRPKHQGYPRKGSIFTILIIGRKGKKILVPTFS